MSSSMTMTPNRNSMFPSSAAMSPLSPKGVMDMKAFEPSSPLKMTNVMTPSLPTGHKTRKEESISNDEDLDIRTSNNMGTMYHGSNPFYGRFLFKPREEVMMPILHTLLKSGKMVDPRMAWERIMDDMLLHEFQFERQSTPSSSSSEGSSSIYVGRIHQGGPRIVVVRRSDSPDEMEILCSDNEAAAQFLVLLRSKDVEFIEIEV